MRTYTTTRERLLARRARPAHDLSMAWLRALLASIGLADGRARSDLSVRPSYSLCMRIMPSRSDTDIVRR